MSRACHPNQLHTYPTLALIPETRTIQIQLWLHLRRALTETWFTTHYHIHEQKMVESRRDSATAQLPAPDPPRCIFVVEVEIKVVHLASWNAPVSWEGSLFWNAALQAPTVFRGLRISLKNADTGTLNSC